MQQRAARQDRDDLSLIPPLAEEFEVYGGKETTERARTWALRHHYLLASGVPICAHGLYLLPSCPGLNTCRNNFSQLDHADLWVPADSSDGERPFILSHPYAKSISAETVAYGNAHGLVIKRHPAFGDGWYGHGSIPIRMTVTENWPVWPIEAKAAVLLATQPVAWPEDDA